VGLDLWLADDLDLDWGRAPLLARLLERWATNALVAGIAIVKLVFEVSALVLPWAKRGVPNAQMARVRATMVGR